MYLGTFAFLLGTLLLQAQSDLPDPRYLSILPLLPAFLLSVKLRVVAAFGLGFLWALGSAWIDLQRQLPSELEGRELLATGFISSLVVPQGRVTGFDLQVTQLRYQDQLQQFSGKLKLSWYADAPQLIPGEKWQLKVKLKRPHGFMNPGGFDYEGWLFGRGIGARGYVIADVLNQRLEQPSLVYAHQRVRQKLGSLLDLYIEDQRASGLLKALVIGDRSGLSDADWALFRETGTSHLVAISGLHIGIVSGLGFYLTSFLWRRIHHLTLRLATPRAAAIAALTSGLFYAALAGFSLPTQRALVMLSLFMAGVFLVRKTQPMRGLALAMLIVLLVDPRASISPSFWLSFVAVGAILMGVCWRTAQPGRLTTWSRTQWLVTLGLLPVLLSWQHQFPLVAPLVNFIAVPLFSLLIVPLALLSTLILVFWVEAATVILQPLLWLLQGTYNLLTLAASLSMQLSSQPGQPVTHWFLAALGTLLLLMPRGWPNRWLGLPLLLPALLIHPASGPKSGDFRFHLLDVGQGMAAVVRTQHHVLVYDTGPKFSPTFDAGAAVLLPFLEHVGIDQVDMLIVSNGDRDHSGGLASLLKEFQPHRVKSGEPHRIDLEGVQKCEAGRSWQWDGVQFTILHPDRSRPWRGNNASCVLGVENQAGRLLISGDIEAEAERHLLACCADALRSHLITVPHHGSLTSSTSEFVAAGSPRYALSSNGYRNRYGFPREPVVRRWTDNGSEFLTTAASGAISFHFGNDGNLTGPIAHRSIAGRYWNFRQELRGDTTR